MLVRQNTVKFYRTSAVEYLFGEHSSALRANDGTNLMGAWDHTTFGNDDACDWGGDLGSHEDLSFVEEALGAVVETGEEYLEAPESCQAIAAAEAVARLQGHFGIRNTYTESVDEWVAAHPLSVPTALARKAHAALDRILARPSELLDLWAESDAFQLWMDTVTELKTRIQRRRLRWGRCWH